MFKWPSFKSTTRLAFGIFAGLCVFHLAVILAIAFFEANLVEWLWGGRLQTNHQLLAFEAVSLLIVLLCAAAALLASNINTFKKWALPLRTFFAMLFLLFMVNTLGNLVAKTVFEKLFSAVTLLLAFLCLRIAVQKPGAMD